jgi:hypothetical protein
MDVLLGWTTEDQKSKYWIPGTIEGKAAELV